MSDSSQPHGLVHGILQARILEWVAFPFSSGSSRPKESNQGLLHCRSILYQLSYQRKKIWPAMQGMQVQTLVGELRAHFLCSS